MQTLGISRELLWPDVSDEVGARTAAHFAMWASFIVAAMSVFFVLIARLPKAAFIDAALFLAVGIGIRKMSRFAAVSGLVLYVSGKIYGLAADASGVGWRLHAFVIPIIITFLFISSVRGTFGYQRQKKRGAEQLRSAEIPAR